MSERTALPPRLRRPEWVNEFRAFIMRGNVVGLAIGIIIGSAFTAIVNSLVRDLFTPVIGFLSGGNRFNNIFITLAGPKAATLAGAQRQHLRERRPSARYCSKKSATSSPKSGLKGR